MRDSRDRLLKIAEEYDRLAERAAGTAAGRYVIGTASQAGPRIGSPANTSRPNLQQQSYSFGRLVPFTDVPFTDIVAIGRSKNVLARLVAW
jgi:pSer/pThr/pTyr-binding forkhead associated (FHA) protein